MIREMLASRPEHVIVEPEVKHGRITSRFPSPAGWRSDTRQRFRIPDAHLPDRIVINELDWYAIPKHQHGFDGRFFQTDVSRHVFRMLPEQRDALQVAQEAVWPSIFIKLATELTDLLRDLSRSLGDEKVLALDHKCARRSTITCENVYVSIVSIEFPAENLGRLPLDPAFPSRFAEDICNRFSKLVTELVSPLAYPRSHLLRLEDLIVVHRSVGSRQPESEPHPHSFGSTEARTVFRIGQLNDGAVYE